MRKTHPVGDPGVQRGGRAPWLCRAVNGRPRHTLPCHTLPCWLCHAGCAMLVVPCPWHSAACAKAHQDSQAVPCHASPAVPRCTAPAPHREEVRPARRGSCWKVRPEWLIGKAELGLVTDGSCWGRTRAQLPGHPHPPHYHCPAAVHLPLAMGHGSAATAAPAVT